MAFLPLGKSVLPVVLEESTKAHDDIDAKVHHDGICISLGKIAEVAEDLQQGLPMRGLPLVELAHPSVVWVIRLFILGFPHFGVRGSIILVYLIFIVILHWITITASWWWSWPLNGGRRVILILTLIVVPSYAHAVGLSPWDSLGRVSRKGRDQ
jgi:hypothetical protein